MDTKETAIEFIKSFKEVVTSIDIENGEGKAIEEYNDKIDKVIELLQRGGKYEKIYKKLKDNFPYLRGELEVQEFIEEFEQKYFPKGGNQ